MKSRICLLLLSLFLGATTLNAAQGRMDGNWWRGLPETMQTTYVLGYMDGYAHAVALETALAKHAGPGPLLRKLCPCTVGQIFDGLKVFYQDPANRLIDVAQAIQWLNGKFLGDPEHFLQEELQDLRKHAAEEPEPR